MNALNEFNGEKMSEEQLPKDWFARRVEKEARKDVVPSSERVGQIVAIVGIFLVTLFFVAHQFWSTGFFTSKFGPVEAFLFYAAVLFGVVTAAAKGVVGRKNAVRSLEVLGGVLFTVASIWLFIVFPFNFSHFADVLPDFLRFLLQWISDDIVKVLLALGIIAAPIIALYNFVLYVSVRRELSKA